jgi:hypothetical protein
MELIFAPDGASLRPDAEKMLQGEIEAFALDSPTHVRWRDIYSNSVMLPRYLSVITNQVSTCA